MRTSFKFIAATVALGASVLGSAAANANPIALLYSTNGGSSYTQFGTTTTNGLNSASTAVGNYTISATAIGTPVLTAPNFQSTTLDVSSSGAGTLMIAALESGLTTPNVSGFTLGFTSNLGSTVGITESFALVDSLGNYTQLASSALTPNTAMSTFVPYVTPANYTLVELYAVTFGAAGGTMNATISATGVSVPEPMSMSLLGAGLVGLGVIRMRRKSV